jgi:acetyl esterase
MASLLQRIRRAQRQPMQALTVAQARAAYAQGAEVLDLPRAPLADVLDLHLPLPGGRPRAARLYRPQTGTLPVLLYFHGGGFVIGSLETHDSLCRQLALRSGGAVLALDYRLAPEHPFPAAWEDAWAALDGLMLNAPRWGLDAARVAVGGDSAGGTLAAFLALQARDRGLRLALQTLITPGLAPHAAGHASRRRFAQGFLLDDPLIDWFFAQVLHPTRREDWRFAPLLADELEGVAPVCLLLAECDPLVDEGLAYADRLRMAGVPVQLELVRGVTHDFIKMGRALKEAGAAQQVLADALRQAWRCD